MKNPFKFILLIVLSATLFSCSYEKIKLPEPTPIDESVSITYTNFAKRMVENNHCLECHSGPTPAAGRDYSTFSGIQDVALNGSLKLRAIDGVAPTMPKFYPEMDQAIKDTLTLWINQGAPQ